MYGLNENWKQTLGIYFGNVSGARIAEIIKYTIEKISEIGYNIVSVNCDQGSNNRSAYKILGATTERPYFMLGNKKIFLLYDVPHLFKSVRNRLLTADISISENEIVSWTIISNAYSFDSGTVKTFYKLSRCDIFPNPFEKLSIKLYTQIFSKKIALGIFAAINKNCYTISEKSIASSTADFIFKLNRLFDHLNNTSRFSPNPDKNAISNEDIEVIENIKEAIVWIRSWKYHGKMKIPYCFAGFLQTLNGILQLWSHISIDDQQNLRISIFHSNLRNCLCNLTLVSLIS